MLNNNVEPRLYISADSFTFIIYTNYYSVSLKLKKPSSQNVKHANNIWNIMTGSEITDSKWDVEPVTKVIKKLQPKGLPDNCARVSG